MRIGIDYTAAVRQGGGIGRYTRNLIRALAKLDSAEQASENQYALFVAGGWGEGDGLGPWPQNFGIRPAPLSDRWMTILWQRLRLPLPIQLFTGPLDLFHSPDFVLPPVGRTPAILTVHDLSFLRVPEHFVPGFCEYLTGAVSRAVGRADHILADSESTRRDLVELLAVDPDRVTVIYPGVEPRFRPIEEVPLLEQVRARYRLPERFILGLGTLQPRKNFDGLIRAFARLPAAEDLHLVIAGGKGWMYEETLALPARLGLEGRVHFPGFVDDTDLPALYNVASVFAFPSWYEGFGLPVLEAMACGTPVVAADNSSLPEAVGDAGLMIEAGDAEALADSLVRLMREKHLRERLAAAGIEWAQRFTWEAAARQLASVYRVPGFA
ncbi:MAG: glycosyltransferase family 1 protein [Anaerolineae bacterium]|jgi:glycosyltransferase involved in cell wall biosynthesis